MNKNKMVEYSKKVISHINTGFTTKLRIKEDIIETLTEKAYHEKCNDPWELMGDPKDVAREFSENLSDYNKGEFELKSSINILGLPLYHITTHKNRTAKGIFAIGYRAIGLIAAGTASLGVISLGTFSLGLLSLGGLTLGLAGSLGGIALAGSTAIGGIAIAKDLAIGGLAIAENVAIGGAVMAQLMAYKEEYFPPNTEIYSYYSYNMPHNKEGFLEKYRELYYHYGFIKDSLIKLALK